MWTGLKFWEWSHPWLPYSRPFCIWRFAFTSDLGEAKLASFSRLTLTASKVFHALEITLYIRHGCHQTGTFHSWLSSTRTDLTSSIEIHTLCSKYATIHLNIWQILESSDSEIIAMDLIKQVKLAACMLLAKKTPERRAPAPSLLFMEQSFAAARSLKVKFLKRGRKQARYTY